MEIVESEKERCVNFDSALELDMYINENNK